MFSNFLRGVWAGDLAGVGAAAGDALAEVFAGTITAQVVTFVEEEIGKEEKQGFITGDFSGEREAETSTVEYYKNLATIESDKPGAVRPRISAEGGAKHPDTIADDKPGVVRPGISAAGGGETEEMIKGRVGAADQKELESMGRAGEADQEEVEDTGRVGEADQEEIEDTG